MDYFEEILDRIISGKIRGKLELNRSKSEISAKYGLERIPSDSELLACAGDRRDSVLSVLKRKPSRTASGVAIVAAMTTGECPGECIYCPTGNAPKSYTGHEPAALRAAQNAYDARSQVSCRIRQLESIGHSTDKIDLIVMGGTFLAQPKEYRDLFMKGCFDGMNGKEAKSLEEAQAINESATHRCIGATFETRPDFCDPGEVLRLGGTRVELGVQHPDDEIYLKIKRGHTVRDVVNATKALKDAGLKVGYHIMPGLPGSNPEKDLEMFRKIFEDERFRPDMLKIYPCLLVKREFGTSELWELYENGEWVPYDNETAAELIAKAKSFVPRWVRIMRIQRDIPAQYIEAGVTAGNLRELVADKMKENGASCACIRCREIRYGTPKSAELEVTEYSASGGKEVFLSYEDKETDKILAYLRLRLCPSGAFVRELRVCGPLVPLHKREEKAQQHRGYGASLLLEAEKIAKESGFEKLLVTSGVGARGYYGKRGYGREGPHMAKRL